MTITTSSSTTRSPVTIAASSTRRIKRIRRTLAAMVVGHQVREFLDLTERRLKK